MGNLYLPDVTLIAPTGNHIQETIAAIKKCTDLVEFAAVKLVTHEEPYESIVGITLEKSIYPMDSYENYNRYVFEELWKHFDTSHCLLVQYDSWVLHPKLWNNNWLEWDYIGAPWPLKEDSYIAWGSGEHVRVGNGGFSLRSHKLCNLPKRVGLRLTNERGYFNEDGNVTCYHRLSFLEAGIKYAPIEVAAVFSYETPMLENWNKQTFGFHKHMPIWE